jgi:outer membrane protein TolC
LNETYKGLSMLLAAGMLGAGEVRTALAQSGPATSARASAAPQTAPAALDSALAEQLQGIPGTDLGLDEAVQIALQNSAELGQAAAGQAAAAAVVRRERGAFDPALFASGSRTKVDLPTASPFAGAPVLKNTQLDGTVGAGVTLTTGTQVRAVLETTRNSTNSAFASLDPQYDATGRIELAQPLLKGFGPAARGELTAAERELAAAVARYDGTVLGVRAQVERLYWELYAAERDVAVERVLRDGAAALLESAERRARAGLVGPNQAANARVFLADRETALVDGEERLDGTSDRLASLLGQRPPAPSPRYRPEGEPPRQFELASQDSVVALAVQYNHTLRELVSRIEAARARERAARWDALPSLDFVGSLGGRGLAGTGQDVIFGSDTLRTTLDTGAGDTWSQVFKGDFPAWSAGLRFNMPLGRRAGTGERDRRRAEVRFEEQRLIGAQRGLEEVVRARHRELEHAAIRLRFATDGVDAAFEQARIGRLEFESGRTTAFELVRLAGDLASAQLRYSQALVRAGTAAANLRELTGGIYPRTAGTP